MCTTAVTRLQNSESKQTWFLIKTRDPVEWMRWDDEIKLFNTAQDRYKKLIIQNPDLRQDGYYGGINDQGVAYISTFVRVAEDQVSYIKRPYVRLILEAKTAKEAVGIIQSFNPRIGGNMFVADTKECYGIEGVPDQYFVEQIDQSAVKTNHFLTLPHRNLSFDTKPDFEAWSKQHQKRAEKLITDATSVDDLKNILTDRENADKNQAICTTSKEEECFTHSAFIFDTTGKRVHYAQGNPLEVGFKVYDFGENVPEQLSTPTPQPLDQK